MGVLKGRRMLSLCTVMRGAWYWQLQLEMPADLHLCGCTVYINTYVETGPIWSPATVRPSGLAAYIGRWLHCREIHLSGLLLLHFTVAAVDRLHCMLVMCGLMWTESDVTFLQRYCTYIRSLSLQPTW